MGNHDCGHAMNDKQYKKNARLFKINKSSKLTINSELCMEHEIFTTQMTINSDNDM